MKKKATLLLLSSLLLCWACNNRSNQVADQKLRGKGIDSVVHKLKQQAFYNNINEYRQFFFINYNDAVTNERFADAKDIVAAYGCVRDGIYDSVFTTTAVDFIDKKYPVPIDSQYAMLCHFISWNYFLQSNYPKVLYWANRSINSCTFPDADKTRIFGTSDLAAVYVNTNQIDTAIMYYLKCSEIDEKVKDTDGLATDYFNTGSCYYALFAYNESAKYVKKSSVLRMAKKDTSAWIHAELFFPLNNKVLGLDTATTTAYIDNIFAIFKDYKNASLTDSFFIHILTAKKSLLQKDFTQATIALEQCKRINKIIVDSEFSSYISNLDIENEFAQNGSLKNTGALKKSALDLISQGSFYDAVNIYSLLAKSASNLGNLTEFRNLKYQEEAVRDSIFKKNIQGHIFELDKKFQSEKKQQQIILQQKTIQSKTRLVQFLIASIISLILITIVFYLIQRQNKLKQEKQNNLQYTRQLLEKTEEERKRIATDLHDSISHELMTLKSAKHDEFEAVNSKIDIIINDIRIISRNLHPVLFERIGLAGTIEQMIERVQQQHNFLLTADINYTNTLSVASELQVYRIIQEAITNIVKYANAVAGKITINETGSHVDIEIKDSGKGFNVGEVLNSDKAFGLHNIIERSRAIGGKANIASGREGTVIKIEIPKNKIWPY